MGKRSDPFFFDVLGALHDLKFTGDDFFADKDVCSLVLDVPNAALGSGPLGLWIRVLMPADGAGGGWVQVERGARPSRRCSWPATRETPISPRSPRTTAASSRSSRTSWSTPADTRPRRQSAPPKRCCRT